MVLDLTQTGINYLLHNLAGGPPPVFTAIVLGNGADAGGANATALSNPLVSIGISNLEREDNFVNLSGILNNNDITSDFRANEMGVLIQNPDNEAESLLFAYGYVTDEKAMLIPAITDRLFEITENVMVFVGAAENVSAVINSSLATVSKTEFNEHLQAKNPHKITKEDVGLGNVPNVATNDQTPTYEVTKELSELKSEEKMSTLLGKVAKAVSSLIAHLKDEKNPHGVTAEKIKAAEAEHKHSTNDITEGILGIARGGLGADNKEDARKNLDIDKVPNVATNDQTPTYEAAAVLAELTSGEKLSVAFGKIKKAIADLILHLADTVKHITAAERTTWNNHTTNKSNPHGVSASQLGLGNVNNTSDANKPVSSAQATAIADAKKAGTAAQSALNSHTANKNNPHGVTVAQIGALGQPIVKSLCIPLADDTKWNGNTVTFSVSEIPSANTPVLVYIDETQQIYRTAIRNALLSYRVESGSIIFTADGTLPSVDIDIKLFIFK